jgi:hypothetical protein
VRYFLQHDARRFRAVLRIAMRAIEAAIAKRCGQAPRGARVAAVLFRQQFGASLNVHHHGHFVVSDGVYALGEDGGLTFYDRDLPLSEADLSALTQTIRTRVLRHLVRHGCLEPDDVEQMRSWDHHGGFSLDASVHIADWDRAGLARLCRYCARHPFAKGRLSRQGQSRVVYQLPKPDVDGRTALALEPLELLDRLAALILPPRHHRHSTWGALAPHSNLRPFVVLEAGQQPGAVPEPHPDGPGLSAAAAAAPSPSPQSGTDAVVGPQISPPGASLPCETAEPQPKTSRRTTSLLQGATGLFASLWALMLAKVYEVDPLCCPRCGTQMKPVALIVDEQELARICRHQGQAPGIPKAAPARAPPQSEFCFD